MAKKNVRISKNAEEANSTCDTEAQVEVSDHELELANYNPEVSEAASVEAGSLSPTSSRIE